MANMYGVVRGSRGAAHRTGGQHLQTVAASWQGAVSVNLYTVDGTDYARIELTKWSGAGTNKLLYLGPVNGPVKRKRKVARKVKR